MGQYLRPTSVDAALRALGAARLTIIAGGRSPGISDNPRFAHIYSIPT